jgi:flagellar basal body-associated protein FliL
VSLEEDGRNDDDLEDDSDEYEEMELIDQADIDRLMNPSQNPETPQETAASPETAADSEFMETDETVDQATRDDFVISPDQAVNAADCRITQETLDVLMQNPPEIVPAQDPVVLDEPQAARETQVPAPDQVNLDAVDLDAPEEEVLEPLPDQGDVTQEDIDSLLRDPYEEDEEEEAEMTAASDDGTAPDGEAASDEEDEEEDILISQDDIDTLLMGADQEDEDILGNASGNDLEDILDNDAADQDFSDNEDDPDTPDNDQVILEKAGSEDAWIDEGRPQQTGDKWYRSKLLAAVASALLVLAIAVPAAYFLFFPRVPELPITNEQTIQAIGEITRDGQAAEGLLENLQDVPSEVDSVIVDVAPLVPVAKSGSMVLKNFIVLASDRSTDMAYITLDISVDYSDQRAYDEINSNLPFFRDLIYASIQQNLVWEKRNEVTQNELIMGVEAGLKNVLPKGYIDKIRFTSFETS